MDKKWWKEGIIYQIYPRSFQDSNGDGIGDLGGIIQRLDYITNLGVDIIWLNPIYQSPNDDNGYDISNYYEIHPEFGTMAEFDFLLEEVHRRKMRLLMDVVINHTSDEHPWFIASETDPEGPYGDFYFWKLGKNGGPPNNWPSFFGGSTWEYSPKREAYYLHLFSKKQPDLNWENQDVRDEAVNILSFWLEKGIDGFRLDVIPLISKRLAFEDADTSNFGKIIEDVYSNGPRVHEYLQDLNQKVFSQYDIMTVGEGPGINQESVNLYVGKDRRELDMIFHLDHMALDHGSGGRFDPVPFTLKAFKDLFASWDHAISNKGWLSAFLDNHDFPRMVSRFGDDGAYRIQSAKLLAMLILTQRGTPCIYFGSEIGMTNVAFDSIEDYRDVETVNFYDMMRAKGKSEENILRLIQKQGRDNVRTPMQWSSGAHSGFTTGQPWIKVNPNFTEINLEKDLGQSAPISAFYKEMIAFRKNNFTLTYGAFELLMANHPSVFAYTRKDEHAHFMILLNFSSEPQQIEANVDDATLEISNYKNHSTSPSILRPWEAILLRKMKS